MPTGKKPASDAAKILDKRTGTQRGKQAAASDLAQTTAKPRATGTAAASAASKVLSDGRFNKRSKEVAASDLAQAKRSKKKK